MSASRIRIATLVVALAWLAPSQAEGVDFPLLPALQSDLAQESLLLDAARRGERLLVGGELGHILYSDDGGRTWTQADVPVSLAVTSVAFAGQGRAWAAAHEGYVLHSVDNGATWEVKFTGSDVAQLSIAAIERQVAALRAALDDAPPEMMEDAEWALEDGLFALDEARGAIDDGMTSPMLRVWFADDRQGFALGAYGIFLRTEDGGETWVADNDRLDNPDKYHYYGIARSRAGTLLVAGEAGTLLRSLDGGNEWQRVESPYPGSFFGTVATSDGGLLIFGLRGNVFRSTDEGASWLKVDTRDQRTLMCGAASDDGTVVLAGAAGAILRSDDAGASFSVVPTNGGTVYSGATFTPDGEILLVGFGGVYTVGSAAENGDE